MAIVGIIEEILALVQGVLQHFIDGTPSSIVVGSDYEWVLTPGSYTLSTKGAYLAGAIADIIVYGSILVDWIVQSLLGTGTIATNTP